VVYLFLIFHGDVITPNLGSYPADMTILPTALSQSKLLFSINNDKLTNLRNFWEN
jgi:hypothetical protein